MSWGIQTWDASGSPNNYGIKPVSVVGRIPLAAGQNSGAWSFSLPQGLKWGLLFLLTRGKQCRTQNCSEREHHCCDTRIRNGLGQLSGI